MHIESLKYFQEIAKVKSISKVASNSHISQPALSQQIQKLEDFLGKELFIRSNRGVKLTESGEIVLKYADNIIRIYNKMIADLNDQESKEIKIEGEYTIATYCLPCAILNMQFKFPKHKYNLVAASSDKIEQDVLSDICEVGFTTHPAQAKNLYSEEVINEKVVLISPPAFDLPEKLKLEEILAHKFVILKEDCIIKEKFKDALGDLDHNFSEIDVITQLDSTEAIKTLVRKGYGVAFVPYNAVRDEFSAKEINVSRIKDYDLDYDIYMINKRAEFVSQDVKEFTANFKKLGKHICY
ncbi:DNA-binding transcriptional LysR family regulator [Halanaerobium saccharolyticum]|uniref:DNA-binding transcriptional LysR family regulator n=1 Tax=Halanaerobium saccharolyticum TaxID=43595 RepID=A0A4R7Z7M8_9FIRM|nr:LysR family transcriptional regulator [Halanaerobium saccharolyticum]RAK04201.1 DNA-binding transcriptional LysR family regulator [Halanaerobium saccharolyticum]TDW06776.1 DNA-binding transcriptional LysR family regulator [Halanaerobium saccharolyticum]TDX62411.1 DNA-binding transcriptional LysR family regulator [Halanaerobium saccharolyticum]